MDLTQYLLDTYGPTLTMDEIASVTKRSVKTLRNDISAGRFPVPTFKILGRRVAAADDVGEYLKFCQQDQRV